MNKLPTRKNTRLSAYNYSSNGIYFITICTKDMVNILSSIVDETYGVTLNVGETCGLPPKIELSYFGKIVELEIQNINNIYDDVSIEKYVIMPNHLHLLISIDSQC